MSILFSGNAALNDIGQEYFEKLRKIYYRMILSSFCRCGNIFFFFKPETWFSLARHHTGSSHLPEKPGKTMMGKRQVQSHRREWETRSEGWEGWLASVTESQSRRGLSCRNHKEGGQPIAAHAEHYANTHCLFILNHFSNTIPWLCKYDFISLSSHFAGITLYIKPAAPLFP